MAGLGSGLATCAAPMFISEISPLSLRGPLTTLFSFTVTFGIVLAQLLTLEEVLGTAALWNLPLCMYAIPVVVFLLASPMFPESPKYLYIIAKEKDKAIHGIL